MRLSQEKARKLLQVTKSNMELWFKMLIENPSDIIQSHNGVELTINSINGNVVNGFPEGEFDFTWWKNNCFILKDEVIENGEI